MKGLEQQNKNHVILKRKIKGRSRREQQRIKWLDGITDSMDMNLWEQTLGDSEGQGSLACCSGEGVAKSWTSATVATTPRSTGGMASGLILDSHLGD